MTASSPNSDRNSYHRIDTGLSADHPLVPAIAHDLVRLVESGAKFNTIYADPPWPYSNTAARGAAVNHYPTMTLEAIRNEPVKSLAAQDAHLQLWTTNAFLSDPFDVIREWGFIYESCLIWDKPQIGMSNYWRVSNEFLCNRSHKNICCSEFAESFRFATESLKVGNSLAAPHAASKRFSSEALSNRHPRTLLRTLPPRRTAQHRLDRLRQSSRTKALLK